MHARTEDRHSCLEKALLALKKMKSVGGCVIYEKNSMGGKSLVWKVNEQVFQGIRKEKMEENLTSADPLSYTTNGSWVDLVSLVSVS